MAEIISIGFCFLFGAGLLIRTRRKETVKSYMIRRALK